MANHCEWQIDQVFVDEQNNRANAKRIEDGKDIGPIFRYGANAELNKELRTVKDKHEIEQFCRENPNISLQECMEMTATIESRFRLRLSDRELMNQVGEINAARAKLYYHVRLNFW